MFGSCRSWMLLIALSFSVILGGRREKALVHKVTLVSAALPSTCLGGVWGGRPDLARELTVRLPTASLR